ncbi:MAG: DnaJ C-terminal domain-containing protein [Acidobacteriaceae bacterium]|nr:DnaJ C-terminal domain-containing protein [Acidobacteriaceae bacterium]
MFIVKQKPHQKFKRRGADLIVEQELTLEEALTGGKFTFEHLGGKKFNLTVEAGRIVKPSDVMMVDGLGMPDFRAPGTFGKLYVIVNIKFPVHIEEEKLAALLKSIETLDPKTKVNEETKERIVMRDYHPNQRNLREDGEMAGPEEHEDQQREDQQPHGIPCQTQ